MQTNWNWPGTYWIEKSKLFNFSDIERFDNDFSNNKQKITDAKTEIERLKSLEIKDCKDKFKLIETTINKIYRYEEPFALSRALKWRQLST